MIDLEMNLELHSRSTSHECPAMVIGSFAVCSFAVRDSAIYDNGPFEKKERRQPLKKDDDLLKTKTTFLKWQQPLKKDDPPKKGQRPLEKAVYCKTRQSWALSVFFNIFHNKKIVYCNFYKVNNLFLHMSYLKSPLPVKLTW